MAARSSSAPGNARDHGGVANGQRPKPPGALALAAMPGVAQHSDHANMPMKRDAMKSDHGAMGGMKGGGLSSLPSVDGEVRRVDKAAGKVTLRHGEIKQLEMPPMTMVFEVKDKALLDTVNPGDNVNFKVINENGRMIVTDMKPAG